MRQLLKLQPDRARDPRLCSRGPSWLMPDFDGFARILVLHHPRPGISFNGSCADTDESDTAGVIGCVDLRMAVVGHDGEARRYLPFSKALGIESPRPQCTCFGADTLTGRHILVGFNLAFHSPFANEVLQLLVFGTRLGWRWGSLCAQ